MNTNQIKNEVLNYLSKTSNHLFADKDGKLFKVMVVGDQYITIYGENVLVKNIDDVIKVFGNDSKCVIKHRLFLNKDVKSIKNYKKMKDLHEILKRTIESESILTPLLIKKIISDVLLQNA